MKYNNLDSSLYVVNNNNNCIQRSCFNNMFLNPNPVSRIQTADEERELESGLRMRIHANR